MQRPSALGLFLCDQVIVDRDTGKRTLVGMFESVTFDEFPSSPITLDVYAVLTDGQGGVTLDLIVSDIDTGERLIMQSGMFDFPDPLAVVYARYRVRGLSFPAPGQYLFELLAQDETVCHHRLHVQSSEEES